MDRFFRVFSGNGAGSVFEGGGVGWVVSTAAGRVFSVRAGLAGEAGGGWTVSGLGSGLAGLGSALFAGGVATAATGAGLKSWLWRISICPSLIIGFTDCLAGRF